MESYRDRLKRDQRQKRLKDILWLLALFVLAGAVVGGWRYVQRPEFSFGKIAVHGSSNFSVGQLAQMGGEKEPVNLFRFSKTDMLTALRGDVRVEKAEAYYNFPNVLNVYINERQPALYVKTSYRNYAKLDADGLVLDLTDGIKDASVPRLSGKDCGNLFIGDRLQDQDIRDVLIFFQKLKADAKEQISELHLDGEKNLTLQLRYGFPVILGPVNELAGKAELFTTVFDEIKGKNVKSEYMDLQYSKPFIKLVK